MEKTIDSKTIINEDIEKLKEIRSSISEGLACTYDKIKCLDYLETLINPKCAVCRKPLKGEILVINSHKMHIACRKRYRD